MSTKCNYTRIASLLLAAIMTISALPFSAVSSYAADTKSSDTIAVARLAGDDRFGTAAAISTASREKADTVVIANGLAFPDALAGAVLANKESAPILLTARDKLSNGTLDEIKRLGAEKAYILGGTAAVSEEVGKTLTDAGLTVERIAGTNRDDTAALIAAHVCASDIAYLVSDASFADALSISPVAAIDCSPILYMKPDGTIPAETAKVMAEREVKKAYICGGEAAVGGSAESALSAIGISCERISGADRYATSLAIADRFAASFGGKSVSVATGTDFPDALSGAALSAKNKAPVVLVNEKNNTAQHDYISAKAPETLYVFGGVNAVSEETVKELIKKDTEAVKDHGVPVLNIEIDESKGTIEAMNSDNAHDTRCYGSVTLTVPEGFKGSYSESIPETLTCELDYIRGRGNSTWSAPKKPYKLKLAKKQDLLGMGKAKSWGLMANYYDVTMLRNRFTYYLADAMGLPYTSKSEPVEVVMNGKYLGLYTLSELVEEGENRVEIKADGVSDTDIGYIIAEAPYPDEEKYTFFTENYANFLIDYPEVDAEKDAETIEKIKANLAQVESAVFGEGFCDKDGISYAEYLDVDSAVDYLLIQELSHNADAFQSDSTYLYKPENGKLCFGPVWDFDNAAWGAADLSGKNFENYNIICTVWMKRLIQDPEFYKRVEEHWAVLRRLTLDAIADGGIIDQYSAQQEAAIKANYAAMDNYINADFETYKATVTYESEIKRLKDFVIARVGWMDANLPALIV